MPTDPRDSPWPEAGGDPTPDPADQRIGHAERSTAVDALTDACAAGRLTLAEFSDRVARVHAATTAAQLHTQLHDLVAAATVTAPVVGVPPAPTRASRTGRRWSLSLIGDLIIHGRSRLPQRTYFLTLFGDAHLSLTDADLQSRVSTITVIGVLSDLTVHVPPAVDVQVGGFTLFGDQQIVSEATPHSPQTAPSRAPLIRIRLISAIGDVRVRRTTAAPGDAAAHGSRLGIWPFLPSPRD